MYDQRRPWMHSAPGAIDIVHFTVSFDTANGVRSLMQSGLACAARPADAEAATATANNNTGLARMLGNSAGGCQKQ
jgi:hypothetical protein